MTQFREIASGLRFPEGPIAMADGSVLVVEIERGTLSRVSPDGGIEVVADLGGGPNGAAIGPDGAVYVCNNGGFSWETVDGMLVPGDRPDDYSGGRIERVDLKSGKAEVLYSECDGRPLCGPNDIVFDSTGGFWFTDLGKSYGRVSDRGAVYYARADGSEIREVIFPLTSPNGVGLSPDEGTLYVADTIPGRLWQFDIAKPGHIVSMGGPLLGDPLYCSSTFKYLDSLAVDSAGNICVASIFDCGITVITPEGHLEEMVQTDDFITTNICFGGPDLKTAYITLSASGRLVSCEWPRPGQPLHFLNT